MKFLHILTFYILSNFLVFSVKAGADQYDGKLDLTAEVVDVEKTISLKLTIVNVGDKPLVIHQASLPWSTQQSIKLLAFVDSEKNTKIYRSFYPDDPGDGEITIMPGGRVSGQVDIGKQFPSLAKTLRNNSVLMVLDYAALTVPKERANRIIKALIIPKGLGVGKSTPAN